MHVESERGWVEQLHLECCVGGGVLLLRLYCFCIRQGEWRVDEVSGEQLSTKSPFLKDLRLGNIGHATVGDCGGGYILLMRCSRNIRKICLAVPRFAVRSGRAVADMGLLFTPRWRVYWFEFVWS